MWSRLVIGTEKTLPSTSSFPTLTAWLASTILLITVRKLLQDTLTIPFISVTTTPMVPLLRKPSCATEKLPERPVNRETSLVSAVRIDIGLSIITTRTLTSVVPTSLSGEIVLGWSTNAMAEPTMSLEQTARFC